MGRDTVVPRKLLVELREWAGIELHITALPALPPLPSCPHFASSSGSTARPVAPLVIHVRPQLSVNGASISPAVAQSATPQDSLPCPRVSEGEAHTPSLVQDTILSPTAPPAPEQATPQSKTIVSHFRRRYPSAPAAPREHQNWLAKYEEHVNGTARISTLEAELEAPSIAAQALPRDRDSSRPEMIYVLEILPTAGAYPPAP